MKGKYENLFELLEKDEEAGDTYASLPDYIQEMIDEMADSIKTISDLKTLSTNLLGI